MADQELNPTSNTRILTYLVGFVAFVIFVYVLTVLKSMLIPITIAVFMTYLLHPVLEFFNHKFRIPRWLTVSFLLISMFGLYYLLGLLLVSNYQLFADKLTSYANKLVAFLEGILASFNITFREVGDLLNFRIEKFDAGSIFQGLFKAGIIQGVFNSLTTLLNYLFVSLLFWIFMVLGKNKFERRIRFAFKTQRKVVGNIIGTINSQLQSYLIIKTIISIVTATIVTIILWIYGIDFPIAWGVLTFLFNFIPNIGSIIISIFPILVALIDFGFGFTSISLAVLLFLNQSIMGNIVEPHYLGRQMGLSTVFVLFSLIFWGWVWGIVGMFLSVPIASAMQIIFSNIEPLKPIAIIMGNKVDDESVV